MPTPKQMEMMAADCRQEGVCHGRIGSRSGSTAGILTGASGGPSRRCEEPGRGRVRTLAAAEPNSSAIRWGAAAASRQARSRRSTPSSSMVRMRCASRPAPAGQIPARSGPGAMRTTAAGLTTSPFDRHGPKHHPTPLSGGDRKALKRELGSSRAGANILATQAAEIRACSGRGQAALRKLERADKVGQRSGISRSTTPPHSGPRDLRGHASQLFDGARDRRSTGRAHYGYEPAPAAVSKMLSGQ
jgi:hypothetical protein